MRANDTYEWTFRDAKTDAKLLAIPLGNPDFCASVPDITNSAVFYEARAVQLEGDATQGPMYWEVSRCQLKRHTKRHLAKQVGRCQSTVGGLKRLNTTAKQKLDYETNYMRLFEISDADERAVCMKKQKHLKDKIDKVSDLLASLTTVPISYSVLQPKDVQTARVELGQLTYLPWFADPVVFSRVRTVARPTVQAQCQVVAVNKQCPNLAAAIKQLALHDIQRGYSKPQHMARMRKVLLDIRTDYAQRQPYFRPPLVAQDTGCETLKPPVARASLESCKKCGWSIRPKFSKFDVCKGCRTKKGRDTLSRASGTREARLDYNHQRPRRSQSSKCVSGEEDPVFKFKAAWRRQLHHPRRTAKKRSGPRQLNLFHVAF